MTCVHPELVPVPSAVFSHYLSPVRSLCQRGIPSAKLLWVDVSPLRLAVACVTHFSTQKLKPYRAAVLSGVSIKVSHGQPIVTRWVVNRGQRICSTKSQWQLWVTCDIWVAETLITMRSLFN